MSVEILSLKHSLDVMMLTQCRGFRKKTFDAYFSLFVRHADIRDRLLRFYKEFIWKITKIFKDTRTKIIQIVRFEGSILRK